MFIHPTNDYDFLLQMDPSMLPRYLHNVNVDTNLLTKRGKYANKTQEQDAATVLPGFDPAKFFFNDLQVRLLGIRLVLERLIILLRIFSGFTLTH